MAGLYIHIPFCRKACHYCNFHFSTSIKHKPDLLRALILECEMRADLLNNQAITSVYLGGGTPSLLDLSELEKIMTSVFRYYHIETDAEINIETNPEDLNKEKIEGLKSMGFTRLSIGIQSFDDADLSFMNRAHTGSQAHKAVEYTAEAGFDSFSLDLMFGLARSSLRSWEQNLSVALSKQAPHLSCYNLTIEEQTAFYHWLKKGELTLPPDDSQNEQFYRGSEILRKAGYMHYEISNFALPGHKSRHNMQYWRRHHYIGIGPSAHSFDGNRRYWNVSNNMKYIKMMTEGQYRAEEERLSEADHINECIMLGLRTARGIDKNQLVDYAQPLQSKLSDNIKPYKKKGMIIEDQDTFKLVHSYWHLADFISADLFCRA